MNRRGVATVVVFIFLLSGSWAGAWYRGDEYEPRDFPVNSQYYVNQLPVLPSIEDWVSWWRTDDAYMGSAGSYTRRDLFNLQYLKLDKGVTPSVHVTFDFLMDQDYDGIYTHYLLGLWYAFNDAWRLGLIGEPMAQKEFADIGVALSRRVGASRLTLKALAPNFEFEKKNNDDATFNKSPYNLQVEGIQTLVTNLDVFVRMDFDFPSGTRYGKPEFDYEYQSYKPSGGILWTVTPKDVVWGEVASEDTDETRDGFADSDPGDYHSTRKVRRTRVEYIRRPGEHWRYAIGAQYLTLDEQNVYPNKPSDATLWSTTDHITRMLYGSIQMPLSGHWFAESGLILDFVSHHETLPQEVPSKQDYRAGGFEGKVPISVGWEKNTICLKAGVSFQVDEMAFGGGTASLRFQF